MMKPKNEAAPACPPPPVRQPPPRRLHVPKGAVDTHAHVIGPPPYVPTRSYTPPVATQEAYVAMLDAIGMSYGVLTQVSVHGTDNGVLVAALRAHRRRLRGIAVIDLSATDAEKRALAESGVVGLRLNVLYGGGIGLDRIDAFGALCREMNWHLQFLVDAQQLPAVAHELGRLPVPYLIDHMGHFPTSRGIDDSGFTTLVSLVRDGAYVRLSGAFRNSVTGPPWADTIPFAHRLVAANPDRCVWGSDWPHVSNWGVMMTVAELADLLVDWVPDDEIRHRVLVENPHRLFGFDPVG